MIIVEQSADLEFITPDAEKLIERAARTCYKSEGKITDTSASLLIEKIIKRGHLSVLEHAVATFRFVTDRGITHELVRHRLAAYSQESTRYCNYSREGSEGSGEIQFVLPCDEHGFSRWEDDDKFHRIWFAQMVLAEEAYLQLLEAGETPQFARSVLGNSLKTEIVMTANFREWLHVIKLRTAPAAHPQIRNIIGLAADILAKQCPTIFKEKNLVD